MNGSTALGPPSSYRPPPLGGPGSGYGNGPSSSFDEKRDPRNPQQNSTTAQSPLSPTAGSDFSFSKYDNGTSPQRNNLGYSQGSSTNLGAGEMMPNSGSNNSLVSQRSSGTSAPRDSVIFEHYTALKKYLTRQLAGEGLNQRQNKAREKLVRLSKQQFHELSTDVYDELMRRQNSQINQPFLMPKDNFHMKRNQARQKLATLPPGRFKELASDVLYELERRYPAFAESQSPYLSPTYNDSNYLTPTQSDEKYGNNRSMSASSSLLGGSEQTPTSYTSRGDMRDRYASNNSSIPEEIPDKQTSPIAKMGMANTIIPNTSTMIEEEPEEDIPLKRDSLPKQNPSSEPVQKSFFPNTIVPNTSTMIEDSAEDEEDDDDAGERARASIAAASTAPSTKSLSPPIFKSSTFAKANGKKTRSISPPPVLPKSRAQVEEEQRKEKELQEKMDQYEDKIEALQERIGELQMELVSVKEELGVERAKPPPPPLQVPTVDNKRVRELEDENQRLLEELREQQEVTNDVRREATELLEEMKLLTSQQDSYFDSQNNSQKEVARLQTELRDWKSRYTQLKIQVRSSSSGSGSNVNSPIRKSRFLSTDDGVIEDGTISRFQNSIDELLAAARRDDPEMMEIMTEVVKATRAITEDLKRNGTRNIEEDVKIRKLTTRLSATANNLITATKNHVSSQGLSPVSLVDAAASHLTSTVVELVKVVKLRPGSGTTFRSDDDARSDHSRYSETPLTSPVGISPRKSIPVPLSLGSRSNMIPRSTTLRDEVYAPESPRSIDSRRSLDRNAFLSKEEEELRVYLDTQTQAIVESIQSLLTRIRNPKLDSLEDFRPQINDIVSVVQKIVEFMEQQTGKIDRLSGDDPKITSILHSLEDCCSSMRSVRNSEDGFKKRLARIAFDISKQIKELVRIVEETPMNSANDLM